MPISPNLPLVKLDNFEGPFDLLLELAADQKIDLSEVSLTKIADAFLRHIQTEPIAPSLIADFVVIASTLLLLKLRQLLPNLEPDEKEEVTQLSDRLKLYQRYRQQALQLVAAWRASLLPAPERLHVNHPLPFPDITAADLATAMHQALHHAPQPINRTRHLRPQGRSLQQCLQAFVERLQRSPQFTFHEELRGASRDTTAISFLALLELARQKVAQLEQPQPFTPLVIKPFKALP